MCNNFPNIKVVEGNAFSVLVPLKVRTFESCSPIDEDIDPTQLSNVVFKFGGVSYTPIVDERGVSAVLPATLARGTYDIVLTANYGDNPIRAAYESAITIVPWNSQSDAQQYIAGSPIVLDAAYVIGGTLTDAELEALKEEYREKNAQLQQAIEDAEEAKAEWEQKAADLDGVAKESTSQDILTAVENIDIDTSDLAKEATLGTPLVGQPSTIFAAIAQNGQDSKQTIVAAINQMGGSATADMTWAQLAAQIESLQVIAPEIEFLPNFPAPPYSLFYFAQRYNVNYGIKKVVDDKVADILYSGLSESFWNSNKDIEYIELKNAIGAQAYFCTSCPKLRKVIMPSAIQFPNNCFQSCANLNVLDVRSMPKWAGITLQGTINIIDIIIGGAFAANVNISYYDPTNCYLTTSSSLCFDTDLEEYGRTFANNFEKWKWCIINHFAANLPDRTGMNAYTISQSIGSAYLSHFDAEMIVAFTDKNWNLA